MKCIKPLCYFSVGGAGFLMGSVSYTCYKYPFNDFNIKIFSKGNFICGIIGSTVMVGGLNAIFKYKMIKI